MSSDNLTKQLSDDKLERLIVLVEDVSSRQKSLEQKVGSLERLIVLVEDVSSRQKSLEQKVGSLERLIVLVEDVSSRQKSLEQKVDSVEERLSSLESTVDIRLKETRPIWEAIEARLEEVEINLDKVQAIAHGLRSDFRDWRKSVNERVENLESKAS